MSHRIDMSRTEASTNPRLPVPLCTEAHRALMSGWTKKYWSFATLNYSGVEVYLTSTLLKRLEVRIQSCSIAIGPECLTIISTQVSTGTSSWTHFRTETISSNCRGLVARPSHRQVTAFHSETTTKRRTKRKFLGWGVLVSGGFPLPVATLPF
jgi:hypothetical protein